MGIGGRGGVCVFAPTCPAPEIGKLFRLVSLHPVPLPLPSPCKVGAVAEGLGRKDGVAATHPGFQPSYDQSVGTEQPTTSSRNTRHMLSTTKNRLNDHKGSSFHAAASALEELMDGCSDRPASSH